MKKLIKRVNRIALPKYEGYAKSFTLLMRAVYGIKGHLPWNMDQKIENFIGKDLSRKEMMRLENDILFSFYHYGVDAEEYFRYGFQQLSDEGRKRFLGHIEQDRRLKAMADPNSIKILNQKDETYELFKEYYHRELIHIVGPESYPIFEDFCQRNSSFIVKPDDSSQGNGVYREKLEGKTTQEVFESIIAHGKSVVEEIIQQDPRMAAFHPNSVNTVRIVTCNREGHIQIIQSSVRLGTGDSVVDNGCLSAGIDKETGIIISRGREAHKPGRYLRHPDTDVPILGNIIPEWDKLLALVYELPLKLPEQRVIGWDLALSDRGWLMIEANARPALQILEADGVGVRDIVNELEKEQV